jgi:hypothetical protein
MIPRLPANRAGARKHVERRRLCRVASYPTDPHPKNCQFTGPLSLVLEQAIGEEVPGFNSISCDGVVRRCTAYCDKDGKQHGLPMNTWATALWHVALQRQGYERGLRRSDGTVADWLAGNVVVVCSNEPVANQHRNIATR